MSVLQNRNVGIGTSEPANRLHIGDGGDGWVNGFTIHSNYPTIYMRDSDNYSAMLHLNGDRLYILRSSSSNPAAGNSWALNSGGWWPFQIDVNTNEAWFGGRVNIQGTNGGQTSALIYAPGGGLQTDWPGTWAGGLATWDIVGSSTYMTQYIIRSDRRYKKDIAPLAAQEMLSGVMKLKPVSYHYKDPRESQNLNYGLIAQEVREVFPNLLTGKESKTERLGLNYDGFIAPIIASVQLLKKENDAMKAHQQDLKHENDAMKAEMAALRAELVGRGDRQKADAAPPTPETDSIKNKHANTSPPAVAGAAPEPLPQALIVLLSLFVGAGTAYFALRRRSA
jgi:hypothetical protein